MNKEEIFKTYVKGVYPDYEKVLNDNSISERETLEYFNYAANAPTGKKSYSDFKTYEELKGKAHTKGIESIMFRSDVRGVVKDYVPNGDDPMCVYRVTTDYGTFMYSKNRNIL